MVISKKAILLQSRFEHPLHRIMMESYPMMEIPSFTVFKTPGYNPFSVKVSPFDGNLLAVAACQNFGLKGSGRLYIIQLAGVNHLEAQLVNHFDFRDGIFDVAWSEVDRNCLVVGGGDGKIYKLNYLDNSALKSDPPVSHSKEISSLDWCPLRVDKYLSTSWDGSIKISSSQTIKGHAGAVNEARWSPRHVNLLMSVSGDKTARLWDDRSLTASAVITPNESLMVSDLMSLDWNKYEEWNVVIASPSDLLFWDIRALGRGPVNKIPGAHRRAIKRVRFSPWQSNRLASVGFDMSLKSWDLTALNPKGPSFDHFTEFTTGLDWSNFERNKIFSCSWDETVRVHFLK